MRIKAPLFIVLAITSPLLAREPQTSPPPAQHVRARALGIPQGTVKSRAHYALRALRLALLEMGVTA